MTTREALKWFKNTFGADIAPAVKNTPFTIDLLAAIAYQETGYIWSVLVDKKLTLPDILALCVGDTIDARMVNGVNKGRSAFPKNKSDLLTHPNGQKMFDIARQALEDVAVHVSSYQGAAANKSKFCRGFGIFQYDLQFFKITPDYFLKNQWHDFSVCLKRVVQELHAAMARQGWSSKSTLTETEMVHVAIAYNRGKSDLSKGFKQGHKSGGRYYGENIHEFLLLSKNIDPAAGPIAESAHPVLAPPLSPQGQGRIYQVNVNSLLKLRAAPNNNAQVIANLPAGHLVERIDGTNPSAWFEVETSVNTALLRGFVISKWLETVPKATVVPVPEPLAEPDPAQPPAVHAPRQPNTVTRRKDSAGARSLNEPNQPSRIGNTAADRVAELNQIIDWLDVANPKCLRYKPGNGKTFCNIYAHDYCHLADVYLPRVWWRGPALIRIARGEKVEPLLGSTIDEQRANDLFRWLKDFGLNFGWREVASLNELQEAANLGGVSLIIARRKEDGKSGHVVMVVPETSTEKATRGADGLVTNPLQSQAGSTNFSRKKGTRDWFKAVHYAEHAFWVHA